LGDFGFSSLLGARDALSEQNGLLLNFCSVAPEVLKSQSHEQASDIFSVGVLIFVLVAGFPPFCGAEKRSGKLTNVPFWPTPLRASTDALSFPSPHFDAVSAPCRDFLAQLLRVAPAERMSAKQALAHPFLQKAATASNAVSPYANASIKEFLKLWRQRLSR
jgi:serine/threonine protein kinase